MVERICSSCKLQIKGNYYTCECNEVNSAVMHHNNGVDSDFSRKITLLPYNVKSEKQPAYDCKTMFFCTRKCHDLHAEFAHGLEPNSLPEEWFEWWNPEIVKKTEIVEA